MALNIKDAETERLAAEVAALAGETKTRAVKIALRERKERLARRIGKRDRSEELRRFLVEEAWPQVPPDVLGKPLTRAEREESCDLEEERRIGSQDLAPAAAAAGEGGALTWRRRRAAVRKCRRP